MVVVVVATDVVGLTVERLLALAVSHSLNSISYFSNCFLNSLIYFLYLKFDSPGCCSLFTGGTGRGCDICVVVVVATVVDVVVVERCVVDCAACFHLVRSISYCSICFFNSFKYFLYLKFDSPGFCGLFTGFTGCGTAMVDVVVVVVVVVDVVVVVVVVVVGVVVGARVVSGAFPYSASHFSNDCLYFSFSFANCFKYFLYL